jgi:hypothetical protein
MEETNSGAGSSNVLEFIAVADQYCKHLTRARGYKPSEFLFVMQRVLPLLYLKAVNLPRFEPFFEEGNERFVREDEYNAIEQSVSAMLGSSDSFEEPYDYTMHADGEPVAGSISEYLADIYQDVKDCILQYRTGTEEVMNDAIWECSLNFETIWGARLLSVMRAIHRVLYSGQEIVGNDMKVDEGSQVSDPDRSSWFISRRQQEYGEE